MPIKKLPPVTDEPKQVLLRRVNHFYEYLPPEHKPDLGCVLAIPSYRVIHYHHKNILAKVGP